MNHKRWIFVLLGVAFLLFFTWLPPLAPAVDPMGKAFPLPEEGKRALGLFLLAGIWWVFEVVPIGVTSIAIGVLQAIFAIRPAKEAFRDFMDPTVMFIFGSLLIGLAFTKSGLTRRLAYRMLILVGEDTRLIMLGCFVITALLTHLMAHTAVAATMFPILMAITALYNDGSEAPTRFGRALFIGMAYTAGAGSMATMLGGARNPAAVGFFKEFTGADITFTEFSLHLAPMAWVLVLVLWVFLVALYRPEQTRIAGLRQRARELYTQLGPMNRQEIFVMVVVGLALATLVLQGFVPALKGLDRSVPLLAAGLIFFLFRLLDVEDLEKRIPWNIVMLFSGAMSIGFALWKTGAAQWMAINWLTMFQGAHWLFFVLAIAVLVLVMTNFIMNVAAIAITLPVALVIAGYLGVNPYLVLYASVAMASLPLMLLIGAAPNAIAYQSRQFTTGQFFLTGIAGSVLVLAVLVLFIFTVWPLEGMRALLR
jgi:sodium-dependent dicarboxylate transporter 2/3/5